MTAPLTIEQAGGIRGRALSLVDYARKFGQAEQQDSNGHLALRVTETRGTYYVTGRDRQVRALDTEVAAVLRVEELLVERADREFATYAEVAADVARGSR